MYKLLLVGLDSNGKSKLEKTLKSDGRVTFECARGGRAALVQLKHRPADLVVSAEQLTDMTGLEFAIQLVRKNPMVNCALVSTLPKEDFHEASEGLGILAQLPPAPEESQIMDLLQKLETILGTTS